MWLFPVYLHKFSQEPEPDAHDETCHHSGPNATKPIQVTLWYNFCSLLQNELAEIRNQVSLYCFVRSPYRVGSCKEAKLQRSKLASPHGSSSWCNAVTMSAELALAIVAAVDLCLKFEYTSRVSRFAVCLLTCEVQVRKGAQRYL